MKTSNDDIISKKNLKLIFIIVCVAAVIIIPGFYHFKYYLQKQNIASSHVLMSIVFTLVATASISLVNMFTFFYFRRRFIHHQGYLRRFLIEMFVSCVNAVVVMIGVVYLFRAIFGSLPDFESKFEVIVYDNVVIALIVNVIVMTFVETFTLFDQWRKASIESERLLREKAESQYVALKNQVNPHFLFNSLNSLSSLIRLSPEKAVDFVDRFSKIYRYVLEMSDKMVVELRDELDFLQSYYFLQKIRFGDNLSIETAVDAFRLNDFIPPLSIQTLIENALKHNEISSEKPLKITLFLEGDFLVIENNLQLKSHMEKTTGIGLKNLSDRIGHLTDIRPSFQAVDNKYIAKIPLLKIAEA
jgi:two-component system, LytTR family, sensor kinase